MVSVKSMKIDGQDIHIFNSAIYIYESSNGQTLQLDVIVSEVVLKKYKDEESLIIGVELEDGRIISSIMLLNTLPGGLPQLNLVCELDEQEYNEYDDFERVDENNAQFPNVEAGITLEEIRKVEMPNEKINLKLTLPIDQVEWLKTQKTKDLNNLFKQLLYELMKD
ncbi:hypothetical protein [Bacillus sp. T3]|uniref:hypothetical protein n=1 Tax=Bacillus sp. T3 TaxID=467262 RepID=UPI0029829CE7|nr:hypothetical protein [Bacillus sp. T3]